MTQRAQAPWLSDEIRSAKRRRRIAERNGRSRSLNLSGEHSDFFGTKLSFL